LYCEKHERQRNAIIPAVFRKRNSDMPSIETIARPRRNRISIAVPREYASYSFQVILVPISSEEAFSVRSEVRTGLKKKSFVDALLSCPKLDDGETLDISRNPTDYGRDIDL